MTRTVNLLPYENGGYVETDYESGLPLTIFESSLRWPEDLIYEDVTWRWGDDGLIVWTIGRMFGDLELRLEEWVVCYEEEYELPLA